ASQKLAGDFELAGAIIGRRANAPQPAAAEVLRLVLIVCLWRWSVRGMHRESSIGVLAGAIRGVGRHTAHAIPPIVLRDLGNATTLTDALIAADGLIAGPNQGLADAWRDHFEPELRQLARPAAKGQKRPGPSTPPTSVPLGGPDKGPGRPTETTS